MRTTAAIAVDSGRTIGSEVNDSNECRFLCAVELWYEVRFVPKQL